MGTGDRVLNIPGRLNGICPYFTMFPLEFPYQVLSGRATAGDWVIDPFCGRGTTNYACRLLGLPSIGIDSSPVAAALSQSKLAVASPSQILEAATRILEEHPEADARPEGEFWDWAFHPAVLATLCKLRQALNLDCKSPARIALRAVLLGALHGPRPKTKDAYFSNQSPRTYAPKPAYAVRFWKHRELYPPKVDVLAVLHEKAERYYGSEPAFSKGEVLQADSRDESVFEGLGQDRKFRWVITSPPYYGLRTYIQDQWLRYWFLGGPADVIYGDGEQIQHTGVELFREQLVLVWKNLLPVSREDTTMVVRFGGIQQRRVKPLELLGASLQSAGWRVVRVEPAGSAAAGRRQAVGFKNAKKGSMEENDVWAVPG